MERIIKRIRYFFSDASLFRIAYICDLFLCSVGYVNIAAEVGKVFFFVWGLSLFTNRYIADLCIKKVNYYGWLVLFVASNILTLFIRGYTDGIWESAMMILNMPIIFFLFYGLHSEISEEYGVKKLLKELYCLCNIFMAMSLLLNIISIISLYFIGKSVTYTLGYLVVYENRFTGVYFNPNLMAFSSFCAAFCCHLLLKPDFVRYTTGKEISKPKRIVTVISIVMNLVVILLTDSNATALIIICYLISFTCYRFFGGKEIHIGYIFKRVITLIIALALITVTVFTVRFLFQTGATQTITTSDHSSNTFDDSDDELNQITFEHKNKSLDSGRIKLFRQGINVIKHHPVMGVGKGNIIYYGNRYNNDKMKYTDFHNGYLTIIVCSGFVGFAFFIGFAVCLGYRMFRGLFTMKPPILHDIYPCLASFLASYCVYAFFEKTMIFEVSFMVSFFWLILGYAAVCLNRYEDEDYKIYAFSSMELFNKYKNKSKDKEQQL